MSSTVAHGVPPPVTVVCCHATRRPPSVRDSRDRLEVSNPHVGDYANDASIGQAHSMQTGTNKGSMSQRRKLRDQASRDAYLSAKSVPYLPDELSDVARAFLPTSHADRLTMDRVFEFEKATRRNPEARLQILGILRSHSANGAEVPLSMVAVIISACALTFAGTNSQAVVAVILGSVLAVASIWFVRVASAAHARRLTASVWLAAYEDALAGRYGSRQRRGRGSRR